MSTKSKYTPSTNTDVFKAKQLVQWESDNTPPQQHQQMYVNRRGRLFQMFGWKGQSSGTWEWAHGMTRKLRRRIYFGHVGMPEVQK